MTSFVRIWLLGAAALACSSPDLSPAERETIADEIRRPVMAAYDLSRPGAVERLMSLYPAKGDIVSAGGGRFTSSRDSLASGIRAFWENVGRNMRGPRWEWTTMRVDVLSRDAAVMTATYRVPHYTPAGRPHVIGGVWTAVFARRSGKWVIVNEHLSDAPDELGTQSAPAGPPTDTTHRH